MSETQKTAFVTGITGQDGSYLAELLLEKGYKVHGLIRRSSTFGMERISHLCKEESEDTDQVCLHYGDLTDGLCLRRIISEINPDEVYNLGAQSHVRVSFDMPLETCDVSGLGTARLLEAVRDCQEKSGREIRYYQASTSELYGKVVETPQKETTPFYPRSPYGCAKLFSHWLTINYRESYNMHASSGILFNHESPRRGETFVTRKITRAVGRIKVGLQDKLFMGNIDAMRDWGFAGDYVKAMWMMLQKDTPDDYVIATGEMHSVREFLEIAFGRVGLDYNDYVEIDPRFYRPAEVELLLGDPTKAKTQLGWELEVSFQQLVEMMTDTDVEKAERELAESKRVTSVKLKAA
ncbi:GDP-mannose 4,6-dehydratase [Stratiformator vulcanicus]|uniref:GDP-mannose 4,6-dehydratase n=1 Tax=Stratiformator vulcanicus TaxID=2527980 RepID=A0A517QXJ6_9PLAN|nr:GDP-mannose 4,6-dehydratase [Stratiformator vulcanicus]QDT36375.1 GDP-mannose 4,6-dehydratase [Stratiformator vulcanicus]